MTAAALAAATALQSLEDLPPDATTKTLILHAMRVTVGHHMCTGDSDRFRAALAAVMAHLGDDHPDVRRIRAEVVFLRALSAALMGRPEHKLDAEMDLDAAGGALGLLGMWASVGGAQ